MLYHNDSDLLKQGLRRMVSELANKHGSLLEQDYKKFAQEFGPQIEANFISLFLENFGNCPDDCFDIFGIQTVQENSQYFKAHTLSYKTFYYNLSLIDIAKKCKRRIPISIRVNASKVFPLSLIKAIDEVNKNPNHISKMYDEANKLLTEICNSYGSLRYVLTQFPELKPFLKNMPVGEINPRYKVKPRSAFKNPDAILKFFGEASIEGIKP